MMDLLSYIGFLLLLACPSSTAGYPDSLKFDCHPDQKATGDQIKRDCEDRGCLWEDEGAGGLNPYCYYPPDYTNYQLDHLVNDSVFLKKTARSSGFSDDVEFVKVDIIELDDDRLRIRILDSIRERWEPPLPVLNVAPVTNHSTSSKKQYEVNVDPTEGLLLTVTRKATGVIIFQADLRRLIFSNQFIQLIFNVSTPTLYGMGEHLGFHTKNVDKDETKRLQFRMLNHDDPNNPQMASYGSHPFYLMYEDKGDNAHGFLLRNSNPMDVIFTHTPALSIRTIGGILDFFLFLGPSPVDVMRQKTDILGQAPLPPLWSLGFHLCRFGYESGDDLQKTYQENVDAGVPLDAQWADIDYMHRCNMFSYDHVKFANLPQIIEKIHNEGRHFVPILDPAVSADEPVGSIEYQVFSDGLENNVYILNTTNQLVQTRVWNEGISIFPDFTNPNTTIWWKKNLKIFHDKIPFDGLWIDMNEPSVIDFWGQEGGCPKDHPLDRPQFNPMHPIDLEHKTVCMSSRHYLGDHYDLHNLYAFYESKLTYELLVGLRNKRPFLLSRATTTGQHIYSSHWSGDISSRWDYLKMTISGVLSSNLFGYSLVGADICGFGDEASDELCARWSSVGAFYPFARNHNGKEYRRQDPASRPGDVLESAKSALRIRYSLLPFLYTLFYQNTKSGDPVLRSLKMNYPQDHQTHNNDVQFMWGTDLLISGILDEGKRELEAYFPAGVWYHQKDLTILRNGTTGGNVKLSLSLTEVGLAYRGGSIIPTQDPGLTTTAQRDTPFNLIVLLDNEGNATGQLYWDDGESLDSMDFGEYTLVNFRVRDKRLSSVAANAGFTGEVVRVKQVTITGNFSSIPVPNVTFVSKKGEQQFRDVTFTEHFMVLQEQEGIVMNLADDFQIVWS